MEALEAQSQTEQEKEKTITTPDMKYELRSSRGMYLSLLSGRIYSTVLADQEKMTVDMSPAKKNMIPVIYYEDITAVLVGYKLPFYYIFWICMSVISCYANRGMIVFAFLFIWLGLNRKITICLRSGNKAVLYAHGKKTAKAFVDDIKARANI